ncbi:LanC-like protein 3 [Hypsizygus marmoreus]|uniref:LanC-like protein 3 n=1 Tax=Hypsizygus marmoreus TaxID=39966 RepID=A0A369KAD2_HYPMA|nr:LanC-like protein 3 [Hypsizygus marmoreus]
MSSRHIRHASSPPTDEATLNSMKQDILAAIARDVVHVQHHAHGRGSSHTVYIGTAGIALMQTQLSTRDILPTGLSSEDLIYKASDNLKSALRTMQDAQSLITPSRMSFLETDVGVATLVLLDVVETGFVSPFFNRCEAVLRDGIAAAVQELDDSVCDVLYGRAGLLYALLRLRGALINHDTVILPADPEAAESREIITTALTDLTCDDNIQAVVQAIIDLGRQEAKLYATEVSEARSGLATPPLLWAWHRKRYLGAAHGVAGILHILWHCPRDVLAPYRLEMLSTLEWLVNLQDASGNWPTKAPGVFDHHHGEDNELVQWCHGATGILILLSAILRQSNHHPLRNSLHAKAATALHRGARLVYQHGLLRKGVGLCHGIAGSVYALLAASDAFDILDDFTEHRAERYRLKALHLAHLATDHEVLTTNGEMKVPDRPWSLYEGMAGMCCAWMEILCRMSDEERRVGMPGFDDF